jgi:hypothetical protein
MQFYDSYVMENNIKTGLRIVCLLNSMSFRPSAYAWNIIGVEWTYKTIIL